MGADDSVCAQSDQACEQEEEPVLGRLDGEEGSEPGAEHGRHGVYTVEPRDDVVQGFCAVRRDFVHKRSS